MKTCKWCSEGKPEWSFHAKVWIHRRERLDRVCENPPNNYGYTTQVREETIGAVGASNTKARSAIFREATDRAGGGHIPKRRRLYAQTIATPSVSHTLDRSTLHN